MTSQSRERDGFLSGWGDLNSRPSVPQTDALTKLRHSPLWTGHSIGGPPQARSRDDPPHPLE